MSETWSRTWLTLRVRTGVAMMSPFVVVAYLPSASRQQQARHVRGSMLVETQTGSGVRNTLYVQSRLRSLRRRDRDGGWSVRTPNALSPSPPLPRPPPRATIAPPAAHVQRRREGQALLR